MREIETRDKRNALKTCGQSIDKLMTRMSLMNADKCNGEMSDEEFLILNSSFLLSHHSK